MWKGRKQITNRRGLISSPAACKEWAHALFCVFNYFFHSYKCFSFLERIREREKNVLCWIHPNFLAECKPKAFRASQVVLVVKNPPANAGDVRKWVRFLGWEDPMAEGIATHSSILAWGIPMDRGAWWATVRGIALNQTQLKQFRMHPQT